MPGHPRVGRSPTSEPPRDESQDHLSLSSHAFASRSSAMPCPRLASGASGASWGSCNVQFDPRCLDCLRCSLLLHHDRIELSSSQKNMLQNEQDLTSEPLSKPSTGPSTQSLCMKIDSHSCAFFLALTRIIHRPHEKGERHIVAGAQRRGLLPRSRAELFTATR